MSIVRWPAARKAERRFDREHRPFLYLGLSDPVSLPDGRQYQSDLMIIRCRKHGGTFDKCPEPTA